MHVTHKFMNCFGRKKGQDRIQETYQPIKLNGLEEIRGIYSRAEDKVTDLNAEKDPSKVFVPRTCLVILILILFLAFSATTSFSPAYPQTPRVQVHQPGLSYSRCLSGALPRMPRGRATRASSSRSTSVRSVQSASKRVHEAARGVTATWQLSCSALYAHSAC